MTTFATTKMKRETPIFHALFLSHLTPTMPTRTVMTGTWGAWCVVCEGDDVTHEHPDDPRAPKFGDLVEWPSLHEAAWIISQDELPVQEQHFYKRLNLEASLV